MPAVIQDYIDHSSLMYKVYVAGAQVCIHLPANGTLVAMHKCVCWTLSKVLAGVLLPLSACLFASALLLDLPQTMPCSTCTIACTGYCLTLRINSRHGIEVRC